MCVILLYNILMGMTIGVDESVKVFTLVTALAQLELDFVC